ncbi:phytanoyl-CoA dioxygenase [Sphingomonas piscis]|uniref:Phytanoyl-CoA dioxygenase n=1 Tax=Sphingomonas piscis TaxID=2714943 RepID=A0A6G7YME9_9SPHN|nr:phytanoyl-CoA dioxygenase [Sphingomonas piscis]QIK77912.1 phytanoyl-CoA dioxygenase [Sphingomonas piscis]
MTLSQDDIAAFERDGFVVLHEAFSSELAEHCRSVLWQALGLSPERPSEWTEPVVRLGQFAGPVREAANTPRLHAAYDQLVGAGRWLAPQTLGTFPIRFPSATAAVDTGWHIDVSFGTEHPDFMQWRANVRSRGRALLMLFLFTDVGENDAPTRIRVESHRRVARLLADAGEEGLTLGEMVAADFGGTADCSEAVAVGPAGTVYLCHPFLVHAAQDHRGSNVKMMAQPPLLPSRGALRLERDVGDYSPVERAIRNALGEA